VKDDCTAASLAWTTSTSRVIARVSDASSVISISSRLYADDVPKTGAIS